MDEEVVCPLCCEELDISDRQFFPCKCGYQVCMWCWHRIRESESGLCPACRTPYGDDPHEFSAVDVEDVLRANKEKEAAAKKVRDRQRHQSDSYVSEVEGLAGGRQVGQMEVPKDRTQLANMRVIRRNLVYAVGLPPNIATEEQLRKPEYFGQYGKIAKIVINRSQTTAGGDARRGSASAYVTLVHKEDTLACILALDGFYMDGRNVRSSYGTSKYCSAFIKNVRCNNPECTYLHQMGHIEDTFTKQEIQAGYVTSGRDVLARQQQIVQQALSAASGPAGSTQRRRTGGGGPSGTGKASSNPVFPPPSFDEPAKSSTASLVPTPPTVTQVRSSSTSNQNSVITSGFPSMPPVPASSSTNSLNSANRARSASGSSSSNMGTAGSLLTSSKGSITSLPIPQINRKAMTGSISSTNNGSLSLAPAGATAASVVAGVHSVSSHPEPPAPHTTLTPLTPLKRISVASKGVQRSSVPSLSNGAAEMYKLNNPRNNVSKKFSGLKSGSQSGSSNIDARNASQRKNVPGHLEGMAGIGGDVISAPVAVPPPMTGNQMSNPLPLKDGISRDQQSSRPRSLSHFGGNGIGGIGGEVFDGPLQSSSNVRSAIGSGKGKWDSVPLGDASYSANNKSSSWAKASQSTIRSDAIGGGVIGGGTICPGNVNRSGSSTLASMLGIDLPTGSGSLQESSSQLWTNELPKQTPISSLKGPPLPLQGIIGGATKPNKNIIGGVPIGGRNQKISTSSNGSNNSDIALLQSLLPGVHITSGGNFQGTGFGSIGSSKTKSATGGSQRQSSGRSSLTPGDARQDFGIQQTLGGSSIGTIGQSQVHGKQRQAPGSIW
mmetsp:Transcript_6627/g.16299  ORF Transcript_6627/g.16299 Transcript_6627/m.16299 type:complete len:833 (+) Transcript_6627:145-2643(+)